MQTYAQFKTKMRAIMWPAGEAESQVTSHDAYFLRAMIDIQKWVECMREHNVTQYAQCSTYWNDGKTVADIPDGIIRRVYTIANDEWRDKVVYQSGSIEAIECWANKLYTVDPPLNEGLPTLPHGMWYGESSTDSSVGRARLGIWAIHNRKLWIAPYIQSNETVVVEWDGWKNDWAETDGISERLWTPDVEAAIEDFVMSEHARYFTKDNRLSQEFKESYRDKLADLKHWCRERKRQQEAIACCASGGRIPTAEQIEDDAVPDPTPATKIAFIGDWGTNGTPLDEVVAALKATNPARIFTLGDNIYTPETSLDELFGRHFSEYIYPYSGSYESSATEQKIWPALGNHDWDDVGIQAWYDYFTLKGNERYYDVVYGSVHYFILSSDNEEPDGGYVDSTTSTENSIMGEWLRLKMALSTAKWKIVILHDSPYNSDVTKTPGAIYMRWPFKTWGADAVLGGNGHTFEHVKAADLDYFVNGIGGHELRGFGANTSGTILKQYNSNYGFLTLDATCDDLKFTLIDRTGATQYEATITK